MTTILTSELPAGQALEMPCNNLLSTTFETAVMPSGGGSGITGLLFVDGVLGTALGPGTPAAPFQTIQQAFTYATAHTYTNVQIMVAPGTYASTFAVPLHMNSVISGYNPSQGIAATAELSGEITVTGAAGNATAVSFVNCLVSAPTIQAALATEDINLQFVNSFCSAAINTVNSLVLETVHSTLTGNVTATSIGWRTDGASWASTLQANPTFSPDPNRTFIDDGHDTFSRALTATGLAIGATTFVAMSVPTLVDQDDRVAIQVVDPSIQDFICGIHGVGTSGTVTAWITNLSRVSTNFNESVLLLIHHGTMVAEPAP
jgi:hypothetical protein